MPPGTPAFSSENQLTWQQKTVSLAAYAGQNVRLAWRYGSDTGVNEEGWYVDDIAVTNVQIPGSCSSSLIFADGFATGNTSAWSVAFP
jgi:bacillopeptidase F (M6 metalloprotease family)